MAAPTLDGSASGTFTNTNTKTLALTTSNTDDIIVCVVFGEQQGGNPRPAVTGISGASLTWNLRTAENNDEDVNKHSQMSVWWAHAPSALVAENIVATLDNNVDDGFMVVFGANGCTNFTDPWDGNASLPKVAKNDGSSGNTTVEATGVSTDNANTMVLAMVGSWSNLSADPPSGYTQIAKPQNAGGALFAYGQIAYKQETSQLAADTIGFTVAASQKYTIIIDALTDATVGPTPLEVTGAIADDDGVTGSLTVASPLELTGAVADDDGMTGDLTVGEPGPELTGAVADDDGVTTTIVVTPIERPPASQLTVICISN